MIRPQPFDVEDYFRRYPERIPDVSESKPADKPSKPHPGPNRTRDAYSQARQWLASVSPANAGEYGHNKTFGVADTLQKGFDLRLDEALSLLEEWNHGCHPRWSRGDLEKKLLDSEKNPDRRPRGWMLRKGKFDNVAELIDDREERAEKANQLAIPPEPKTREHSYVPDDPASLAIRFVQANQTKQNLCSYRWMEGKYYRWNNSHYDAMPDESINSDIFDFIEGIYLKKYKADQMEVPNDGRSQEKVTKLKVNRAIIDNTKIGLVNLIKINSESLSEPFWLSEQPQGWEPEDVIQAANRLVHLPSFVSGHRTSYIEKTPTFFSTYSLAYDFKFNSYGGSVEPPPIWGKFLDSVFPGDTDSIKCLQEFFGYFCTPDTGQQKIWMLIGPKRSGKGTIIRVLRHMLGEKNVAFPTFKSLTNDFGKQALLGKSLAVFPDARITARTDTGDVVECLLSISGEDAQSINRKHLDFINKKLYCRFLISTNELPRLTENSGALVSRAIVLKFIHTFIGNEDIELESKLLPEIPFILRWALDGWKRLKENKQFTQPESGKNAVEDFLNLSSPISHFIGDCIDSDPEFTSDTRSLFMCYKNWCEWQNRDIVGDMLNFTRNLGSALPGLKFVSDSTLSTSDNPAWSKIVYGCRIRLRPETQESLSLNGSSTNGIY